MSDKKAGLTKNKLNNWLEQKAFSNSYQDNDLL